jgi:hypothetical protein
VVDRLEQQAVDDLSPGSHRLVDPRPWWRRPGTWSLIAGLLLLLAGVIYSIVAVGSSNDTASKAQSVANAPCTAGDKRGPCAIAASLNSQVASLGGKTASIPAPAEVPTVTTTATVPSTLPVITDAMLDAAAQRYFKLHPPPAGKAAVVDYQALRNFILQQIAHITPSPGPTGPTGPTGVTGQPGPGLTQAQADQAMADWCAGHDDCVGPAGANGTNGADGKDGPQGTPGNPPGALVVIVPGPLPGMQTTETCTPPPDQAGPGSQPTYTCG